MRVRKYAKKKEKELVEVKNSLIVDLVGRFEHTPTPKS